MCRSLSVRRKVITHEVNDYRDQIDGKKDQKLEETVLVMQTLVMEHHISKGTIEFTGY